MQRDGARRSATGFHSWLISALLVSSASLWGCASSCPAFAVLEFLPSSKQSQVQPSVTVNGQTMTLAPGEHQEQNRSSDDARSQAIELARHDRLETGPNTRAIVTFANGGKAVLYPKTRVQLGSLWTWLGSLFVSGPVDVKAKVPASDNASASKGPVGADGDARDEGNWVDATSEGTKYHVEVTQQGVKVTVIEGRVTLNKGKRARWSPVQLGRGQRATVQDTRDSPKKDAIDRHELAALTDEFYEGFDSPTAAHVEVPDVRLLEEQEAKDKLMAASVNYEVYYEAPAPSSSGQAGRVIRQSPSPGSYSAEATPTVQLTVVKRGTLVPNVVGMSVDAAREVLNKQELKVGKVTVWDASEGGKVLLQDPVAESTVLQPAGRKDRPEVNLTIGSAPKPSRSKVASGSSTVPIPVPDVTGESWGRAREALYQAGFAVETRKLVSPVPRRDLSEPRVVSQSPMPRQPLARGETVQITLIYPAAAGVIPSPSAQDRPSGVPAGGGVQAAPDPGASRAVPPEATSGTGARPAETPALEQAP